jgi:Domain of unknown function (DUF5122) beta-propeller
MTMGSGIASPSLVLALAAALLTCGDLTARPLQVPKAGSFRNLFAEAVTALAPTPGGGVIAGGRDAPDSLALVRLDEHGTVDRAFSERVLGAGIAGSVETVVADGSGFLVGGTFQEIRPPRRRLGVLRIGADGAVDHGFLAVALRRAAGGAIDRVDPTVVSAPAVWTTEFAYPEEDARWFFGPSGWLVHVPPFSDVLGLHAAGLVGLTFPERGCLRWLANGDVGLIDGAGRFRHSERADRSLWIDAAHGRADGSWILRGTRGVGEAREILWRVDPMSSDFAPLRVADLDPSQILASAVLADGSIVLGGTFGSVRGQARFHLVHLRADGSLD